MQSMKDFKHIWYILSLGGGEGGDPKKNRYFFGGEIRKKNGNFQIFTLLLPPPPPLINNERSLNVSTIENECQQYVLHIVVPSSWVLHTFSGKFLVSDVHCPQKTKGSLVPSQMTWTLCSQGNISIQSVRHPLPPPPPFPYYEAHFRQHDFQRDVHAFFSVRTNLIIFRTAPRLRFDIKLRTSWEQSPGWNIDQANLRITFNPCIHRLRCTCKLIITDFYRPFIF